MIFRVHMLSFYGLYIQSLNFKRFIMSKSKQHLYLFLEENELEYEISSSLVRLSMNRFVVNEAAQFEVIGIYNLKRATKEMADLGNPSYKYFARERTEKDAFDKDLISNAMYQATLHPRIDAHFIIGSFFHPIFWSSALFPGARLLPS